MDQIVSGIRDARFFVAILLIETTFLSRETARGAMLRHESDSGRQGLTNVFDGCVRVDSQLCSNSCIYQGCVADPTVTLGPSGCAGCALYSGAVPATGLDNSLGLELAERSCHSPRCHPKVGRKLADCRKTAAQRKVACCDEPAYRDAKLLERWSRRSRIDTDNHRKIGLWTRHSAPRNAHA